MSYVIEILRHMKPSKLIFSIIAGLTVSSVSLAESDQPSGNLARSLNHEATSPAYSHAIHTEEDTKRGHSKSASLSAKDAVHTSFELMLNHEAAPVEFYYTPRNEVEPFQELVNATLRGSMSEPRKDSVLAGYERMMNREAAPVEFSYTPRNDVDSVQELVNATLRGSVSEPRKDPALAGYERMMNREAASAEFYYVATNDTDTIQDLINTAIRHPWTETDSVSRQYAALESQH